MTARNLKKNFLTYPFMHCEALYVRERAVGSLSRISNCPEWRDPDAKLWNPLLSLYQGLRFQDLLPAHNWQTESSRALKQALPGSLMSNSGSRICQQPWWTSLRISKQSGSLRLYVFPSTFLHSCSDLYCGVMALSFSPSSLPITSPKKFLAQLTLSWRLLLGGLKITQWSRNGLRNRW